MTAAYYRDESCTELRRMSLAGFQKVWFTVVSAQLGFDGASNWDIYWSTYDRTKANQSYWTIGPPEEGWALYPTYYAFQLLQQTTARGWQVLAVDPWTLDDQATRFDDPHPDQLEQELTAYSGPDGQLTIAGLDTRGGGLTAPNGESSSYSVGGLPPFTTFYARSVERERRRQQLGSTERSPRTQPGVARLRRAISRQRSVLTGSAQVRPRRPCRSRRSAPSSPSPPRGLRGTRRRTDRPACRCRRRGSRTGAGPGSSRSPCRSGRRRTALPVARMRIVSVPSPLSVTSLSFSITFENEVTNFCWPCS